MVGFAHTRFYWISIKSLYRIITLAKQSRGRFSFLQLSQSKSRQAFPPPLTVNHSPFTNLFIFFLPFVYLYVIIPFDARYGSGDTPCGAPRKGLHLPCTMRCAKYLRKGESKCLRKKRLLSCRSTLLMRATQVLPRFRSLF